MTDEDRLITFSDDLIGKNVLIEGLEYEVVALYTLNEYDRFILGKCQELVSHHPDSSPQFDMYIFNIDDHAIYIADDYTREVLSKIRRYEDEIRNLSSDLQSYGIHSIDKKYKLKNLAEGYDDD